MSENQGVSRRTFLKQTGVAFAAAAVMPTFIPRSAFGAADRINLAIVGVRGQGTSHIGGFGAMEGVQLSICDIDGNVLAKRAAEVEKRFGYAPKTYNDMRRVFDDKDIDAVTFAIPNHWHALASIWAAQAKKHVYVEKPASWSPFEGRQMVNAARQNNVIMQVGFQNRSRRNTRAAIKLLHEGGIGKVYMCRGLCYKRRDDIGSYPDGPMGADEKWGFTVGGGPIDQPYTAEYLKNVNYDMWIGPARVLPFNRNRFHYNWHWNWEYGNGDTGNQGPHQFDVGRWGLNREDYPVRIVSSGGMYLYKNAQNTPNTQTTTMWYDDGTVFEFATRGLPTNRDGGIMIGDIWYGSEGRLEMDDSGNWKTYMGHKNEPGPDSSQINEETSDARVTVGTGSGGHYGNFIEAVRANDQKLLTCDIEVGHRSSVLPHLGNIAYRLGRELKFDGKTERFVNDAEANKLLRREVYRAPYVVPDLSKKSSASR